MHSSVAGGGAGEQLLNTMTNMANVSTLTSNVSNITKQSMAGVSNLPSNVSSITKQTTANVSQMTKQGMAGVSNLPSNVSNITKQRIKLNVKVLGVQLGSPGAASAAQDPKEIHCARLLRASRRCDAACSLPPAKACAL